MSLRRFLVVGGTIALLGGCGGMQEPPGPTPEELEAQRQAAEQQRLAVEQDRLAQQEEEARIAAQQEEARRRQAAAARLTGDNFFGYMVERLDEGEEHPDSVLFGFGLSTLSAEARGRLDIQAEWLNDDRSGVRIMLNGYADSTGDATFNRQLAGRRAAAVRAYLIEQGVSADRIAEEGNVTVVEGGSGSDRRVTTVILPADHGVGAEG